MSKLSFRARALDPSKSLNIHIAEELPDLTEYSAINRAVPQMPSGMEKEEESVSFFFSSSSSSARQSIFNGSHFYLYTLPYILHAEKRGDAILAERKKKSEFFFSLVRALFDMYALAACIFFRSFEILRSVRCVFWVNCCAGPC